MRCRFGQEVKAFAVIGSTQSEAKRLADAGASEGTLVIAERQRKGRGRLGRSWASPPGGLWCSLVLRPQILPAAAPQLTLVASLAVTDAIAKVTDLRPAIKWPNDVLVEGKKVCGILTEIGIQGNCLQWAIVGIGINVNNEIPPSLIHRAISLQAVVGRPVDRKRL
ncbi:MAG: biotin--[acetyl-CoA-carboxylase] ligase, partial [Elusimicrobia bacterium]|nr:biotin--[acetyl-CoA-carboxylase] ligase [Elusimicrobiota bacterium]